MTFLPKALRLNQKEMVDKIMSTKFVNNSVPLFACMHNTGLPSLKTWANYSPQQRLNWGDGLNHYYKFTMKWSSGPHACSLPEDYAYQLCDFSTYGIHASCFNHVGDNDFSWGVETLGDFRTGGDDPNSEQGKKSIDSAINILAAMHLRMNWSPGDYEVGKKGLHFHLDCKRDAHACPGNFIKRADIVKRIEDRMTAIKNAQSPVAVKTS